MKLNDYLMAMTAEQLKSAASLIGLKKTSPRKEEIIHTIISHLIEAMPQWLEKLENHERLLLAELAHRGGAITAQVFTAKYNCAFPLMTGLAYDYFNTELKKSSPLIVMIAWDGSGYVLADELCARLQTLLPRPVPIEPECWESVPEFIVLKESNEDEAFQQRRMVHTFSGEAIVLTELRRTLALAQAGKVRVTLKSGRPTPATVSLMEQTLAAPDLALEVEDELTRCELSYESPGAVRAHAWPVLLQQCGWCKSNAGRLALTKLGARLLNAGPRPEDLRQGLAELLNDNHFDELNRVNHIRGQSGKSGRSGPGDRRQCIIASMHAWPERKWLDFDEAVRLVFATEHEFTIYLDPWWLYLANAHYGSPGFEYVVFDLERQYLRALLMESLATLGLVEIAYTYPHELWPEMRQLWDIEDTWYLGRYDGLFWVRLTALGAFCLGLNGEYTAPVPPARKLLRALPTLDLVAPDLAMLTATDRRQIERWAGPRSQGIWRLDRGRILDQLQQGGTIDELRRFLEAHVDGELPPVLETYLSDIERAATALVKCEAALLVEARDEHAALIIAHDTRAGKLCRHAGGCWLAVPRHRERAFRTALSDMGHILPHVGADEGDE